MTDNTLKADCDRTERQLLNLFRIRIPSYKEDDVEQGLNSVYERY